MAYITSQDLQTQLENLAGYLGTSVAEVRDALQTKIDSNTGRISTNETDIAGILTRLNAIDVIDSTDGVETLAEKINTLNELLGGNGNLATDLLQRITTNETNVAKVSSDLAAEKTRVSGVESAQALKNSAIDTAIADNKTLIDGLANKVATEKTANATEFSNLNNRVSAVEADSKSNFTYTDINGNVIEGKVNKAIRDANTTQSAEQKTYTDTKTGALQSQIDTINNSASLDKTDLNNKISAVDNKIEDTTDANGNIVKGLKTKVSELQAKEGNNASAIIAAQNSADLALTEAKSAGLQSGIICGAKAANKFRLALGLTAISEAECGTTTTTSTTSNAI